MAVRSAAGSGAARVRVLRPRLGLLPLLLLPLLLLPGPVGGNPLSRPYIALRTDPLDQPEDVTAIVDDDAAAKQQTVRSRVQERGAGGAMASQHCPLPFVLGVSRRLHGGAGGSGEAAPPGAANPLALTAASIAQPPVVYPVHPAHGPGRQVVFATLYEHLDLLTPASLATTADPGDGRRSPAARNKEPTADRATGPRVARGVREVLLQAPDFPLLLEGSAFRTAPLLHDVDADGRMDAILTDYDGGLFMVGLATGGGGGKRLLQTAQVPRLFLRRAWLEARVDEARGVNASAAAAGGNGTEAGANGTAASSLYDPYHSYFELYSSNSVTGGGGDAMLRAVTANLLRQDPHQWQALQERRRQQLQLQQHRVTGSGSVQRIEEVSDAGMEDDRAWRDAGIDDLAWEQVKRHQQERYAGAEQEKGVGAKERQVEELAAEQGVTDQAHRRLQEEQALPQQDQQQSEEQRIQDPHSVESNEEAQIKEQGGLYDDTLDAREKESNQDMPDIRYDDYGVDDPSPGRGGRALDPDHGDYDPDSRYGTHDDMERYGRDYYDDYYRHHNTAYQEYYDSKHYIRISPHVLATATLAELPKLYTTTGEKDEVLFIPVSYYLDEDEYEGFSSYQRFLEKDLGDETEVDRGRYVASAIVTYILGEYPRWSNQQHLDLSTDRTAPENITVVGALPLHEDKSRMGAFALASPTVADIDGDGKLEVLMGTSMGIVYCLDARNLVKKDHWPNQMPFPVESRVIVEDVAGDANLEIFVSDTGGNVVCLSHEGKRLWHRNLATSVGAQAHEVSGTSPMVLGDLNGDGKMKVVIAVTIASKLSYIFAMDAATGVDLIHFPMLLDSSDGPTEPTELHVKLPQPLIVDLTTDPKFIEEYIRRQGAPRQHVLSFGHEAGLHIVYPSGETLYIIDGASGCTHPVSVGEVITASVQVDDVHGTNRLDLVVPTRDGNIVTLESQSPYHPLNVWNNGETRSRFGGSAHGYSSSQGIYVHETSRQYTDVFGVYVIVTLEVFDNRRKVAPEHRRYEVQIRDGSSPRRILHRAQYDAPGVYTERVFVRFGPGYYSLHAVLTTSHGLVYEDVFHLGYNVHYLSGFGTLLWLPLVFFGSIIYIAALKHGSSPGDDGRRDDTSEDGSSTLASSLPT